MAEGDEEFLERQEMYVNGWRMCPYCEENRALQGHLTCGQDACDEQALAQGRALIFREEEEDTMKTSKKAKTPCPRCGRAVTHRTAKQREACVASRTTTFDIDGANDPKQSVVFAAAF